MLAACAPTKRRRLAAALRPLRNPWEAPPLRLAQPPERHRVAQLLRGALVRQRGAAMSEHFETESIKKGRGKAQASLDLIGAMFNAAEAAQPITGRGIGYKLFTAGLIPSMARSEMQRVYRLLREAREQGDIPWEWIVDETRSIERTATWDDPT